jgi:hypothetical protein
MRLCGALLRLAVGALAWTSSSCAPSGFASEASIASVRILAAAADKPYARPSDTVTVQVLAFDGRSVKPEPMTIYWLPFVCENPKDDAYFGCFAQLAGMAGAKGGSKSGTAPALKPGVDLTPFLPTGPTFTFQMPADAVSSHPTTPGVAEQYGLVILFDVACAGHLELVPIDPGSDNPQQIPIGCFDSHHQQLGADDWVFGFTRVYAYDSVTNANPVISGVDPFDLKGKEFAFDTPPDGTTWTLVTKRCTAGQRADCPKAAIGPIVPPSSQETQTQMSGSGSQREEIWADFYSTFGEFKSDARLLYDVTSGSVGAPSVTDNQFLPPNDPGDGFIWIVVHDNRGGASWVTVPVHV